ncbi:MAG: hypothetical protein HQL56_03570 [Magnetococcales bacterium]|nr:hypothetical protein [Magnetococcales bacterium]
MKTDQDCRDADLNVEIVLWVLAFLALWWLMLEVIHEECIEPRRDVAPAGNVPGQSRPIILSEARKARVVVLLPLWLAISEEKRS